MSSKSSSRNKDSPGCFEKLRHFFCEKRADEEELLAHDPTGDSGSADNDGCRTPKKKDPVPPMSSEERHELAKQFIRKKNLELGCDFNELPENAKVRLREMMGADYNWSPTKSLQEKKKDVTTFADEFKAYLETQPFWDNRWGKQRPFFFKDKDIEKYLVIRKQQNGGNCYMHAVVVFIHYIQTIRSLKDKKKKKGRSIKKDNNKKEGETVRHSFCVSSCLWWRLHLH